MTGRHVDDADWEFVVDDQCNRGSAALNAGGVSARSSPVMVADVNVESMDGSITTASDDDDTSEEMPPLHVGSCPRTLGVNVARTGGAVKSVAPITAKRERAVVAHVLFSETDVDMATAQATAVKQASFNNAQGKLKRANMVNAGVPAAGKARKNKAAGPKASGRNNDRKNQYGYKPTTTNVHKP